MIEFHEIPKLIFKAAIISYKIYVLNIKENCLTWQLSLKFTKTLRTTIILIMCKKFCQICYSFISANANLSNFSCHFWKHESVFLQILPQFSLLSNIPPLYIFSFNITYFSQRSQLKSKFFIFSSPRGQISHVKFEMKSQFLLKFCIILHCHCHNSFVSFKLIHFLLWT